MAFKSGHTALKAVRCVCVYVLDFLISVYQLVGCSWVHLTAQVGGLVDSLKKTGMAFPQHPSNPTNVLLPVNGYRDKYRRLTPWYSPLILLWIHPASQGCISGSLCSD